MNNGNTARRQETELRDREVWRLRIDEHLTHALIAKRVGLSEVSVLKSIRRTSRRLCAEFNQNAHALLAENTASLAKIYVESMAAWERSRLDQVTETEEDAAGTLKSSKTKRTQHGDAQMLNVAMKALADARRLWGLDDEETRRMLMMNAARQDDDDEAETEE